uniref:Probable reverse transcriptase At2g02650-, related n=1 Tax=Medicago truncatula TaxID=3880 RepID=A2Q4Z0_MEDTR|nr:probable reverse transcriptase At2g02650 -, related [Medicago truncatula]
MCICDDAEDFGLAKTYWFSPLCDVDIGEGVSFHTTLEWTSYLQFDNVDFALDSKKVVDAFRTCVEDSCEFGCIILACR